MKLIASYLLLFYSYEYKHKYMQNYILVVFVLEFRWLDQYILFNFKEMKEAFLIVSCQKRQALFIFYGISKNNCKILENLFNCQQCCEFLQKQILFSRFCSGVYMIGWFISKGQMKTWIFCQKYVLIIPEMVVNIWFSVVSETKYGQTVCLAGNVPSLGSWEPIRALPLYTTKDLYPQWKSQAPISLIPGILLEFKIVVLNRVGAVVRWEQTNSNRSIVPTSSIMIGMEEGRSSMSFQKVQEDFYVNEVTPEQHQQQKKRGTVDIINDLSDYSESSSGNQSHFWNEKLFKSSKNIDITEQFLIHSKIVTDNWLRDQKPKLKLKPERSFKIKEKHIHLRRIGEVNMKKLSKSYFNDYEDKKMNVIDSHFEDVEEISFEGIEDLRRVLMQRRNYSFEGLEMQNIGNQRYTKESWQSKDLEVYHISAEDTNKEIVDFISKKMYSYIAIYYNEENSYSVRNDYDPNFIIIKKRKILEEILSDYEIRGWRISLLKEKKLILVKDDATVVILYESNQKNDESNSISSTQKQKNSLSTGPISHLIFNTEQLTLPAPFRMSKLFQPKILKNLSMKKIILIINCDKIQSLSQKIINDLIYVTCKNSIEAFIITEDNLEEIFKKMPLSEKNKMIVLNKGGSLFSHNKKLTTLLESSTLSLKNFKVHLKNITRIIEYWKELIPLIVEQKFNEISIEFPQSIMSKILISQIRKQISTINAATKYQLSIKDEEINGNFVMKIRPSAFSSEFYARTILNMHQSIKYTPYIFYFECRKKQKIRKINNIFENRNILYESFIVRSEKNWNCIDFVSMSIFLRTIGHFSSEIMESESPYAKNKAISRSNVKP